MTKAIKWTIMMVAMVTAYTALLTTAFAEPTKGELKSMMNERLYAAYPNCIRDNRISMGDNMWCTDRALVLMDDDLNKVYKDVMQKFKLLDNKRSMIRKVQRRWIKFRDDECLYRDSTDGMFSSSKCVLDSIALSIHYLTRLKQIQFDADGLKAIDAVIDEYASAVS
jgi:uncharacterized protein YecT (DUF1311 family)